MKRSEKNFRNQRFETPQPGNGELVQYQSQSQTANTIGGPWEENRGRRTASERMNRQHYDNPFEEGELTNWNHRSLPDEYFSQRSFRSGRKGGAILNADEEDHRGRGPRGYVRSDERILEDVNEILYHSRDVDARDIEVRVKDGCVFLTGTIESRDMKKMAEYEVENISGVTDVQNRLTIDDKTALS